MSKDQPSMKVAASVIGSCREEGAAGQQDPRLGKDSMWRGSHPVPGGCRWDIVDIVDEEAASHRAVSPTW